MTERKRISSIDVTKTSRNRSAATKKSKDKIILCMKTLFRFSYALNVFFLASSILIILASVTIHAWSMIRIPIALIAMAE